MPGPAPGILDPAAGGLAPLLLTALVYTGLSVTHPISHVDPQIVASFDQTFDLSPWALLAGGCRRFGRLPVTWASGVLSCVVFCNQIIATLMTNDLMTAPYAVYLYAVPVCYLVTKRRWFPIGPCPTQGNVVE